MQLEFKIKLWLSKCDPWPRSINITCKECKISVPNTDLLSQNLCWRGLAICELTNHPGDFDTHWSVVALVIIYYLFLGGIWNVENLEKVISIQSRQFQLEISVLITPLWRYHNHRVGDTVQYKKPWRTVAKSSYPHRAVNRRVHYGGRGGLCQGGTKDGSEKTLSERTFWLIFWNCWFLCSLGRVLQTLQWEIFDMWTSLFAWWEVHCTCFFHFIKF